ncbi:hypothetical protein K470DRAFT_265829 [Piedraia hortae CBS 480.64]|uniref:Uncharacterized protein n=1 Tax=Piedraia hortae CBS 480.64 TaxID=1314780 RepID=A0A6A7BW30_9PEZI|nr:hypothetical protein K470DRAFT_265829 [Piedraia hortae CBS 480.64]
MGSQTGRPTTPTDRSTIAQPLNGQLTAIYSPIAEPAYTHANTAQASIIQANATEPNIAHNDITQHNITKHNIAQHDIAQASTAQANTADSNTPQSATAPPSPIQDNSTHPATPHQIPAQSMTTEPITPLPMPPSPSFFTNPKKISALIQYLDPSTARYGTKRHFIITELIGLKGEAILKSMTPSKSPVSEQSTPRTEQNREAESVVIKRVEKYTPWRIPMSFISRSDRELEQRGGRARARVERERKEKKVGKMMRREVRKREREAVAEGEVVNRVRFEDEKEEAREEVESPTVGHKRLPTGENEEGPMMGAKRVKLTGLEDEDGMVGERSMAGGKKLPSKESKKM